MRRDVYSKPSSTGELAGVRSRSMARSQCQGHGTVKGIHRVGTNADNTIDSIAWHDHHPGAPVIVHHAGKALTVVKQGADTAYARDIAVLTDP